MEEEAGIIPKWYQGREQAMIKHSVLSRYLERLFMIIGKAYPVINYVDCFAGPWTSKNHDLSDTSVGVALKHARQCRESLAQRGKQVAFRLLFIEKDKERYRALEQFVEENQNHEGITVECIAGDFVKSTDRVLEWSKDHFSFYFIDPKGYTEIGTSTLKPLLMRRNSEFLINFMYDFYNRFAEQEFIRATSEDLLGRKPEFDKTDTPDSRAAKILRAYLENINTAYQGKTSYISILRPDKNRVLYYLAYLTRHPRGIIVFKEEAEKVEHLQRVTMKERKLREQLADQMSLSLFDEKEMFDDNIRQTPVEDNRDSARIVLEERLRQGALLMDIQTWSNFLETTDLYPQDFQLAMKSLLQEGLVEVIGPDGPVDASKRRKYPIKPDNNETWRLKSQ